MTSFNDYDFYSWAPSALHFINIIRTMSAELLKRVMGVTVGIYVHIVTCSAILMRTSICLWPFQ